MPNFFCFYCDPKGKRYFFFSRCFLGLWIINCDHLKSIKGTVIMQTWYFDNIHYHQNWKILHEKLVCCRIWFKTQVNRQIMRDTTNMRNLVTKDSTAFWDEMLYMSKFEIQWKTIDTSFCPANFHKIWPSIVWIASNWSAENHFSTSNKSPRILKIIWTGALEFCLSSATKTINVDQLDQKSCTILQKFVDDTFFR